MGRVKVRNCTLLSNGGNPDAFDGGADNVMPCQFFGGVDVPLSVTVRARIGYRYFATGKLDIDGFSGARSRSHNPVIAAFFTF